MVCHSFPSVYLLIFGIFPPVKGNHKNKKKNIYA